MRIDFKLLRRASVPGEDGVLWSHHREAPMQCIIAREGWGFLLFGASYRYLELATDGGSFTTDFNRCPTKKSRLHGFMFYVDELGECVFSIYN